MTWNRLSHPLMALILLLAGCAGTNPALEQSLPETAVQAAPLAAGRLELPSPSAIEREVLAVDDFERIQFGDKYYPLLPAANVSGGAMFPNWTKPADGLAAASYGCYRLGFSAQYDDEARVWLRWLQAPADYANLYVAVANFSSNRWDWAPCGPDGVQLAADAQQYISPGNAVYVCVLLLGSQPANLFQILFGSNTKPYGQVFTDLSPDPSQNTGPRNVVINASQVEALGGEIVSWDFDFDGDGSWDVEGDTDGLEVHNYAPGEYSPQVRVTESGGKQNIFGISFVIVDPFNQAPVAVLNSDKLLGQAPLAVKLDGLSCSDADGYITKYEYDINFDGTYDIVTTSPDPQDVSFSAFGANSVMLRVTDNNFAQSTAQLQLTCTTGWQYAVVDPDATLYEDADLAVIGSGASARAAVAYVDYPTARLRFRLAGDAAHVSWGPQQLPAGSNSVGQYPGVSMAYNALGDFPMIAYTDYDGTEQDKLHVVRAQNGSGTSWNQPQLLDGGTGFGYRTDIAVINNLPVVAAIANPGDAGLSEVRYYQSADNDGAAWSTARVALAAQPGLKFHDIALSTYENGLFDRPLISAACETGPPFDFFTLLARAGNVDGTSWQSPQKVIEAYCYQTDLLRINGNPAVLSGSSSQGGQLYYLRSTDDAATGFGNEALEVGPGGNCELDVWGGRPCILAEGLETDGLVLIRAADADGSAWEAPIPVERRYAYGDHCTLAVVNDMPVVCYVDTLGQRLLSAAWKGL